MTIGSALMGCGLGTRRTTSARSSPAEHESSDLQSAYEWTELIREDEVRLLVLKPGHRYDTVQCELRNVQISDSPTYEAISYAWESETLPCTIYVSGRPLWITENLFSALQIFRLPTENRILWVDALSINQRDLVEKGEQVRLLTRSQSARLIARDRCV